MEDKFREYGLLEVRSVDPRIEVDLRYATPDNFTGFIIYAHLRNAYLVPEAARRLSLAQDQLSGSHPGFHLHIYDAARPLSVQRHMYELVKGTPSEQYVAAPDKTGFHNYGVAVDLTITDSEGKPLDMGSAFDSFTPLSHVDGESELVAAGHLSLLALENRLMLRSLMTAQGFSTNPYEWWHFQLGTLEEVTGRYPLLDF